MDTVKYSSNDTPQKLSLVMRKILALVRARTHPSAKFDAHETVEIGWPPRFPALEIHRIKLTHTHTQTFTFPVAFCILQT